MNQHTLVADPSVVFEVEGMAEEGREGLELGFEVGLAIFSGEPTK